MPRGNWFEVAMVMTLSLSGTAASALTMEECRAKYKVAMTARTLGGLSWHGFQEKECGIKHPPRRQHFHKKHG